MARLPKIGLDYYPFDTSLPLDDKVKMVRARFGLKGYAVYTLLLCKIYRDKGYYCNWGEDEALLFAHEVGDGVNIAFVNDVVHELLKRGLLDAGIFERFKILTSKGIQERYSSICKQLKRSVEIRSELDCRGLEMLKRHLIPENREFPPELSPEIREEMQQKKGKEKKEKESKGEEIKNISTRDPVWIEKVCVAYRTTEKQLLDFCEDWIVKKEVELLFERYPPKACVAFMLRDFCDKKDALPNQTKTSIKTNDPYIEWEKNKSYGS